MQANYPDGSMTESMHAELKEAMEAAAKALDGGATSVHVFTSPHRFVGRARRCHSCGKVKQDGAHAMPKGA